MILPEIQLKMQLNDKNDEIRKVSEQWCEN